MAITWDKTTVASPSGVQGKYPIKMDIAHEGMVADGTPCVIKSYRNETGNPILFGSLVQIDTTNGKDMYSVKHAASATGIVGVAVSTTAFEGVSGTSTYTPNPTHKTGTRVGYPDNTTVNVMSKGVVWVVSTEAVAIGNDVRAYISVASVSKTGAAVGRFVVAKVNTKTIIINSIAAWRSTGKANGLVMLELNIPGGDGTIVADSA